MEHAKIHIVPTSTESTNKKLTTEVDRFTDTSRKQYLWLPVGESLRGQLETFLCERAQCHQTRGYKL